VLAQAAGFAVLAAVSPTALLVMAIFLGSAEPRRTALMYVVGAVLMTVVMAIVILFVLRATGLNQPRQRSPRYGVRLGLGVIALGAAAFISRRKRPALAPAPALAAAPADAPASAPAAPAAAPASAPADGEAKRPGLVARLTANPSPRTAFLLGLLLFAPSTTFIAAVQVVATANSGVPVTAAAIVVVVILTVLIVWLPLLAYLAFPETTTRSLAAANGWLRKHGRELVIGALWIAGVVLIVNGALGI
jgi:threonine/homoserine/homoserine lactone efflux protein